MANERKVTVGFNTATYAALIQQAQEAGLRPVGATGTIGLAPLIKLKLAAIQPQAPPTTAPRRLHRKKVENVAVPASPSESPVAGPAALPIRINLHITVYPTTRDWHCTTAVTDKAKKCDLCDEPTTTIKV